MVKRTALLAVKVGVPIAILAYLFWDAQKDDAFTTLAHQSKNWPLLGLSLVFSGTAVLLTLIRWYYLVRALEIPFTLKDALRIGLVGYLFNLAPMGVVGGDLLKAYLLALSCPGRRTQAVASVFVDRVIGLYLLFVVASAAILLTGFADFGNELVRTICTATHAITIAGTVAMIALMAPDLSGGASTRLLAKTPVVGGLLEKVAEAVAMYRRRWPVVLASALMSVAVHSFFSIGVYLICAALYEHAPSLAMHFVISPLGAATGVLPIVAGPFEIVLNFLYTQVPTGGGAIASGQGLVVALSYRIVTVVIAVIGYVYYLANRAEVAKVIHEAERYETGPRPQG